MISLIRKIVPKLWLGVYHRALAIFAAALYGHPSNKLIVVGVTGTNGKSTTVNLIAEILNKCGLKTGMTSTVNFRIGDKIWLNPTKMTMLGRFKLQKLLRQMVNENCSFAVIETSSEGVAQFRHLGINYDVVIFLNITPEHIESHGGFENYKKAKLKLFEHLTKYKCKQFNLEPIPKTIVVNLDSPESRYFLNFKSDKKIGFEMNENKIPENVDEVIRATKAESTTFGSSFTVLDQNFDISLLGGWNISNALAAISVGKIFNVTMEKMAETLRSLSGVPGRMELINEGQDFTVIVDYAPQPQAVEKVYEFLKMMPRNKIIHVLGSTGGGRDKSRRPILGRLAGENADIVIVTNEDPYDDEPMEIINQVADGAASRGKIDGLNLFKILDRREAIAKAISLAKRGDLVLLTGKGAEQAIVVKNRRKIPWDERVAAREEIRNMIMFKVD